MKTTMKFLLFGIMALAVSIASCEKEGQQGPIGPAGAQGIAGPEGPAGADGADGADGEAQGVPGPQGEQGETGSAGPQGETGATGATGPTGPPGSDGSNGADGNTNIIVSDWLPTEFESGGLSSSFFIEESRITTEMIESAVFLAYGGFVEILATPLPLTFQNNHYSYDVRISGNTKVFIFYAKSNNESPSNFDDFPLVRYVIIPSATSGKNKGVNFKKMTYEEVMDYFDLDH